MCALLTISTLSLLGSLLLAVSNKTGISTSTAQVPHSAGVLLLLSNSTEDSLVGPLLKGQDDAGSLMDTLESVSRGITSLGFLLVAGEDHQLAAVLLQALSIDGQGRLVLVPAAVVNSNTNGLREVAVDSGFLKNSKSKH